MCKNIFLHLWHVIAHWSNHVPRPRVQTNTPNYTFSSFCLHPTLIGLKCLIYNTLSSVDNTAIHLHYHLHTHLCTAILHCDSRAGNGIGGGSGFSVAPIGRPLPLCRETRVAQPFSPPCLHHLHYNCGSADKCRQVQAPVHTKSAVTYTTETSDNQRSADTLCKIQAKRCKTSDACAREHLAYRVCTQT